MQELFSLRCVWPQLCLGFPSKLSCHCSNIHWIVKLPNEKVLL